ncbi:Ataxin 2-like [Perkinsus olseni]|uniref:Ataxin 2-like n=1 Tax=Perkinsus olseni TaxID=32597 RepID=A0A7J6MM89_PEROL|nr:Ataxin 2-like [Perkinsus olseni]
MAAPKDGGVEREKGDLWAIYIGGWTEIEDKILSFLAVPSSYLTNRFRWNYYDHQIAACKTAAQANTLCLVSKGEPARRMAVYCDLERHVGMDICELVEPTREMGTTHWRFAARRVILAHQSGAIFMCYDTAGPGNADKRVYIYAWSYKIGSHGSADMLYHVVDPYFGLRMCPTTFGNVVVPGSDDKVSIERLLRSRFCSSNNRDDSFDRASAHRQAFRALLQRCDTRGPAKRINLYGCEFLSDSELSQIICLCCDVLTHLDLFECSSLSSEFIGVLRAATRLEHVNLRGLDQLTCRALCAWLGSSSICHLRYINLSGVSDCRDEVLTTIAENRVSECIQEVYVARTLVTDAGLVVLIENCHNLKALDVAANLGVSDTLLDAVVTHGTSLQWIDLRGTSIHDDAVANLLALMPSLGVSWMSSQGNVALVMTDGVAGSSETGGLPPSDGSTPLDLLFASVLENDPLARIQGEWHGLEDHKTYKVQGSTVHVSKDGVPLRTYDKLLQHKDGTIYWGSSGRYILDSNTDTDLAAPPLLGGSSSFSWERQTDSHTGEVVVRPDAQQDMASGPSSRFIKMNDLAEIEGRKHWYSLPSSRANYVHVYIKQPAKRVTTWWKLPSSVTNYVRLARQRPKGSVFQTDHEILSKIRGYSADDEDASAHALHRVDDTWLEADTAATADFSATENLHWDQFKVNEERFGVHTSFNWKLYTTEVPKNLSSAQRSKVETIAREIEKEESQRGKSTLRGTDDEEALYGAVIGTGRYAQPQSDGNVSKNGKAARQPGRRSPQRETVAETAQTSSSSSAAPPAFESDVKETILNSLQGLYSDTKGKRYLIEGDDSFAIDAKTGEKGVSKPLVVALSTVDSDSAVVKWGTSGLYSYQYPSTREQVAQCGQDGIPQIPEIVWKSRSGNIGHVVTVAKGLDGGTGMADCVGSNSCDDGDSSVPVDELMARGQRLKLTSNDGAPSSYDGGAGVSCDIVDIVDVLRAEDSLVTLEYPTVQDSLTADDMGRMIFLQVYHHALEDVETVGFLETSRQARETFLTAVNILQIYTQAAIAGADGD